MNRLTLLLLSVIFALSIAAKPVRTGTIAVELRTVNGSAPIGAGELFSAARGQLLRTYPAAAVGRIPETALNVLVTAAGAKQFTVVVHAEWDTIHLPNASFDTRTPPTLPGEAITSYPAGNGLFVLQFDSPLAEEDRQKLELNNLQYISYFNYNAMLIAGNEKGVESMASDEHVVWSSIFQPAFRARPLPKLPPESEGEYLIQTPDVNAPATRDRILASAIGPVRTYRAGVYLNFVGRFSQAVVYELLRDPYVIAVELQHPTMSFVMLPVFAGSLPGAYESSWETTFSAYNSGMYDARYQPLRITFPTSGFATFAAGGGYRVPGDPSQPGSRIFWVERERLPDFHFSLRVRDQSRQSQSAGINIPVVRESEFTDRVTLVDVPIDALFRHSLRIYYPQTGDRAVRVRIYEFRGEAARVEPGNLLVDTTVTLKGERSTNGVTWSYAAEAAIHNLTTMFPRLTTVGSVRIDIDPVEPGAKLWAFVAVTNNVTQEITTVTPQ